MESDLSKDLAKRLLTNQPGDYVPQGESNARRDCSDGQDLQPLEQR